MSFTEQVTEFLLVSVCFLFPFCLFVFFWTWRIFKIKINFSPPAVIDPGQRCEMDINFSSLVAA